MTKTTSSGVLLGRILAFLDEGVYYTAPESWGQGKFSIHYLPCGDEGPLMLLV